jgi:hypothetical protein
MRYDYRTLLAANPTKSCFFLKNIGQIYYEQWNNNKYYENGNP